jgi:hypothetical protein
MTKLVAEAYAAELRCANGYAYEHAGEFVANQAVIDRASDQHDSVLHTDDVLQVYNGRSLCVRNSDHGDRNIRRAGGAPLSRRCRLPFDRRSTEWVCQ